MNLSQIRKLVTGAAGAALVLGMAACGASGARTQSTKPDTNANTSTPTTMHTDTNSNTPAGDPSATAPALPPLPTLPAGRRPQMLETPLVVEGGATREAAPKVNSPTAVVFQWGGGAVGRNDLWTIFRSGRIQTNKGHEYFIEPQAVDALVDQLDQLGYFQLAELYETKCADCFEYKILVYKGETKKAVYAVDAGNLPAALNQSIAAIREVVLPTK